MPGVATGLAWTPTGGEILFIEATRMRGKGGLTLTGHLGEVMKESAQAALSYVRSNAPALGIAEDFFERMTSTFMCPPALLGRRHGSGADVIIDEPAHQVRHGDDGRDYVTREGAPGWRDQGEGAGGGPCGHYHRDPAAAQ